MKGFVVLMALLMCGMTLAASQTADSWIVKGSELYANGSYDEAIKCFDSAIKLDPSNSEAWYNKGQALKRLGREDEAKSALDKADELSKKATEAVVEVPAETTSVDIPPLSEGGISDGNAPIQDSNDTHNYILQVGNKEQSWNSIIIEIDPGDKTIKGSLSLEQTTKASGGYSIKTNSLLVDKEVVKGQGLGKTILVVRTTWHPGINRPEGAKTPGDYNEYWYDEKLKDYWPVTIGNYSGVCYEIGPKTLMSDPDTPPVVKNATYNAWCFAGSFCEVAIEGDENTWSRSEFTTMLKGIKITLPSLS